MDRSAYLATSEDVPGLVAEGRSITEAAEIAQGLARKIAESCLEHGDPLPPAHAHLSNGTIDLLIPVSIRWWVASPHLTTAVSEIDIGMVFMPYFFCMKMTMHIDEALLKRVMAATGVSSKTRAVDLALRELDRRAELVRLAREGLGLTAEKLKHAYNPASDPDTTLRCAEARRVYGRKSRSR